MLLFEVSISLPDGRQVRQAMLAPTIEAARDAALTDKGLPLSNLRRSFGVNQGGRSIMARWSHNGSLTSISISEKANVHIGKAPPRKQLPLYKPRKRDQKTGDGPLHLES